MKEITTTMHAVKLSVKTKVNKEEVKSAVVVNKQLIKLMFSYKLKDYLMKGKLNHESITSRILVRSSKKFY